MAFDSFKDKGLSGLSNLGNTCFLNSAFQCLSHTYELTNFLDSPQFAKLKKRNESNKEECDLLKEYDELRKIMWSENCVVSPGRFVSKVQHVARIKDIDIFTGYAQNDLPEFLLFIMNIFHSCIQRKVTMNINGDEKHNKDTLAKVCYTMMKNMYEKEYSEIIKLFYGIQVSTIYNMESGEPISHTPEPFFLLNLPLPKKRTLHIYDCFDLYTNSESLTGDNQYELEVDIESGDEKELENDSSDDPSNDTLEDISVNKVEELKKKTLYIDAKKELKFFSLPDVLVVDLKRFDNFTKKNNSLVDFELENLDLSKYVTGYNSSSYVYDLYGICNHSGSSMGGHYTSFVKNANGNWYHFNDTNVSEVKDVSKMKTSKAYCFFYRKKK